MKKKILLILLICLFIFSGCSGTKLIEGKDYHLRGEFSGKYIDITKRGYYIDTLNQIDAPYLYIICMGEKSTGGYSLEIKEINNKDGVTEVIVKEIVPDDSDIVTMAFTSPTIIVEFPEFQENIVIKNTKGEIFEKLN